MKPYTVADTAASLAQNRGVEIMASSFEEARDKAEVMGVPCRADNRDFALSYEGLYSITDGIETRDLECEYAAEAEIHLGEEGPELL